MYIYIYIYIYIYMACDPSVPSMILYSIMFSYILLYQVLGSRPLSR
jgi:hypothetical protein